jgi:chromosome segregation ATPase
MNEESFSEVGSLSIRSQQDIPHISKEEELKRTVSQLRGELDFKNKEMTLLKSDQKSVASDSSTFQKKISTLEASLKASQLKNDTDKLEILKLRQQMKEHEDLPRELIKQNKELKDVTVKKEEEIKRLKI